MASAPTNPLSPDPKAVEQPLTDTISAVALINGYCIALQNTVLAPLPQQGDWYNIFKGKLATAQAHATNWITKLGPLAFSTIPQGIIDHGDVFMQATTDVIKLVNTFPQTPTPAQHQQVVDLLGAVLDSMQTYQTSVSSCHDQLVQFSTDITADHRALTDAQTGAQHELLIDKQTIDNINAKINELTAKMQADSQKAMLSEIGLGVAIFVLVAAIALAVATGGAAAPLVVGGVALLGVGGAIAGTVIFSKDVQKDLDDIHEQQQALSDEQAQVTALQGLVTSIGALVDQSTAAQTAVGAVLDTWATLTAKLKAVVDDVTKAEAPNLHSIIIGLDLQTAQTAWGQLVTFAQGMQTSAQNITVVQVQDPNAAPHVALTDIAARQRAA